MDLDGIIETMGLFDFLPRISSERNARTLMDHSIFTRDYINRWIRNPNSITLEEMNQFCGRLTELGKHIERGNFYFVPEIMTGLENLSGTFKNKAKISKRIERTLKKKGEKGVRVNSPSYDSLLKILNRIEAKQRRMSGGIEIDDAQTYLHILEFLDKLNRNARVGDGGIRVLGTAIYNSAVCGMRSNIVSTSYNLLDLTKRYMNSCREMEALFDGNPLFFYLCDNFDKVTLKYRTSEREGVQIRT